MLQRLPSIGTCSNAEAEVENSRLPLIQEISSLRVIDPAIFDDRNLSVSVRFALAPRLSQQNVRPSAWQYSSVPESKQ